MSRCSTRRSRRRRPSSSRFGNITLHNIEFVFFELSATKLALQNTFILGVLVGDHRHGASRW